MQKKSDRLPLVYGLNIVLQRLGCVFSQFYLKKTRFFFILPHAFFKMWFLGKKIALNHKKAEKNLIRVLNSENLERNKLEISQNRVYQKVRNSILKTQKPVFPHKWTQRIIKKKPTVVRQRVNGLGHPTFLKKLIIFLLNFFY